MDTILDDFNPTIELVRKWGYNENVFFVEQDEDLALHDSKYTPVLLELASDSSCPKHNYCLSILTHYSQIQLAFRQYEDIENIAMHLSGYNKPISYAVNKWKLKFAFIHDLISHPRELSTTEANEIAFDLTVGEFCSREFKEIQTLDSGYIEYIAYTESYKAYFYIHPKTCFWRLSRSFPISDI